MPSPVNPAPLPAAAVLRRHLQDARARTLSLVEDLDDDRLMGPKLDIVNPLLWEIGHLAWFQEHWVLRQGKGRPPLRADGDALYDSSTVAHSTRWDLPLPSRAETLAYMNDVLEQVLATLERDPPDPGTAYFVQLATCHEDMHDEAFTYTRQTLGYPEPRFAADRLDLAAVDPAVDAEYNGGVFPLGAVAGRDPFVLDNEKWAHEVRVSPFSMSRSPVSRGEMEAFVNDNGYARRELWEDEGWAWRESAAAEHPVYWRRGDDAWEERRFDRWQPLTRHAAMLHVNYHEARAYCRWAKRRLPTEAEWEFAAAYGGRARPKGAAWEWTDSVFAPYPGFAPDPYVQYSLPWFDGRHQVLRGGAWATRARLLRNTWRNFYPRDRRDVLAGFRTCALT